MKMWDVKGGDAVATLHGHKAPVTAAAWNANGNWLLTASRDHTCKVLTPPRFQADTEVSHHGATLTSSAELAYLHFIGTTAEAIAWIIKSSHMFSFLTERPSIATQFGGL